jgi:hypothetical protein
MKPDDTLIKVYFSRPMLKYKNEYGIESGFQYNNHLKLTPLGFACGRNLNGRWTDALTRAQKRLTQPKVMCILSVVYTHWR